MKHVLSGPLGRPPPADPPTGDEVAGFVAIGTAFTVIGMLMARMAWTTPPEQIDERFSRSGSPMRAGLAGIPLAVGMPITMVGLALQAIVGDTTGIWAVLPTVGIAGMALAGLYVLAYYWVRLPDALLPPPQRGRGGQWNQPDGTPAR